MPFEKIGDIRVYYRLEGIAGLPLLVLSSSIGSDHSLWAQQMPDLLDHFQVLRYDTRGHGATEAPPAEYSIELLARDLLGLLDALDISQFAFCGLSLGGMIGQWVAMNAPKRLTKLILANTSPRMAPASNWNERRRTVLRSGMAAIVDSSMQRFFLKETLAHPNPYVSIARAIFLGTDPIGYAGCCSAIRDMDHTEGLAQIHTPTLVIVGDGDVAAPWKGHGEVLAKSIPGAKSIRLPAAHISNMERPRSFVTAMLHFLLPQAFTDPTDPLELGSAVRRAVLGDAHVDRSIAATTDFNCAFQEWITRYAWGAIWTRPGLDRRTRRLLVLTMMAALGRWEEFRMHVGAALDHGLEPCDLKELLLQSAIYAGVPVANTGFKIAIEEIEKRDT
jgi:3-oxoadipate enol-lactonase/4-carboxymuconolactone decarboxylase